MCLLIAAKSIRQNLFGSNSLFNGNFDYSYQESSVPKSLLVLLRMILEGTKMYICIPVYLGLMIHSITRVKGIIEKLAILGLSITYNHVSEIQEQEMKQEIKRFDEISLACPKNLKPNVFTTPTIDNIDHNSALSTAQSHFHGTSVSVFQHSTDQSHISISFHRYKIAYQ